MSKQYPQIAAMLFASEWAILPSKLETMIAAFDSRAAGGALGPEELAAIVGQDARPEPQAPKKVAVVPLFGAIVQHAGMVTERSGGTSAESFAATITRASLDPEIGSIVIHANSPGGSTYGIEEAANAVYAARQRKPVYTAVNSVAASAGYWIASQADQIYITPGGEVGSIGIVSVHRPFGAGDGENAAQATIIATPAAKGLMAMPMSDELRAEIEQRHANKYAKFVGAVARGRRTTTERASSEAFGGGRMVLAEDAVKAGMADGVATVGEVIRMAIDRLGAGRTMANANRIRLAEAQ